MYINDYTYTYIYILAPLTITFEEKSMQNLQLPRSKKKKYKRLTEYNKYTIKFHVTITESMVH